MPIRHQLSTLAVIAFSCGMAYSLTVQKSAENQGQQKPGQPSDAAAALKPFNSLVGSWRGVGQLQRGSRVGAWIETVTCEWNFSDKSPQIVLTADKGRQFRKLVLNWDAPSGKVVLVQHLEDGIRTYRGDIPEQWPERMTLVTDEEDQTVFRCTIQQLSDIRCTLLFEQRSSASGSFRRIAGIGYTRAGERLAVAGGGQRVCIVTGGLGTIAVTHKGQTYYVCCQGCVQAFNNNPDAIIAEYRQSLKKE